MPNDTPSPTLTPEVLEELTKALSDAETTKSAWPPSPSAARADAIARWAHNESVLTKLLFEHAPALLATAQRVQELETNVFHYRVDRDFFRARVAELESERDEIEEIIPVAQGSYQTIVERVSLLRHQRDHLSEGDRLHVEENDRLRADLRAHRAELERAKRIVDAGQAPPFESTWDT